VYFNTRGHLATCIKIHAAKCIFLGHVYLIFWSILNFFFVFFLPNILESERDTESEREIQRVRQRVRETERERY